MLFLFILLVDGCCLSSILLCVRSVIDSPKSNDVRGVLLITALREPRKRKRYFDHNCLYSCGTVDWAFDDDDNDLMTFASGVSCVKLVCAQVMGDILWTDCFSPKVIP